jgi:putative FmdB family regulatory protein
MARSASVVRRRDPVPTYQYACTACEEQLEVVQKFSDDPLTECPACGSRLRKVFSPVGIVFKGSGFYRTDSRNGTSASAKDTKPQNGSDSGSTKTSDKPSTGDSSKPAAESTPAKKTDTPASSGSSTAAPKVA